MTRMQFKKIMILLLKRLRLNFLQLEENDADGNGIFYSNIVLFRFWELGYSYNYQVLRWAILLVH
jgi:hypothetical protein